MLFRVDITDLGHGNGWPVFAGSVWTFLHSHNRVCRLDVAMMTLCYAPSRTIRAAKLCVRNHGGLAGTSNYISPFRTLETRTQC